MIVQTDQTVVHLTLYLSSIVEYDCGTSWSVADNTGLNLTDFPGQTAQSTKDAQMTVNNGNGGTSCSLSTSGGPFTILNSISIVATQVVAVLVIVVVDLLLHHQLIVIVYLLDITLVQDLLELNGNTLK